MKPLMGGGLEDLRLRGGIRIAFATPILEQLRPEAARVNPRLARLILARRSRDPGLRVSNVGGWHSRPDLLSWPGPEIALVKRWIQEAMAALLDLAGPGAPRAGEATLSTEAWANVHRRGGYARSHVHPFNHWSGVYYVRVGRPDGRHPESGAISFADPRPGAAALPAPGFPFGDEHVIRPRPGLLLVFPSWLAHSVAPVRGAGERISVAFNVTVRRGGGGR